MYLVPPSGVALKAKQEDCLEQTLKKKKIEKECVHRLLSEVNFDLIKQKQKLKRDY